MPVGVPVSVVAFPSPPEAVQAAAETAALANADAFQALCLQRWINRKKSRRHSPRTMTRDLSAIKLFLAHAKARPWEVNEEHFEAWNNSLVEERGVTPSTQRTYQGSVRRYFEFLTKKKDLQNRAAVEFGGHFECIAHADNCLVHGQENESKRNQDTFSREQIEQLLEYLRTRIDWARAAAPRQLRALQRDRAMIFVIYAYALRSEECESLNTDSWSFAAYAPELRNWGQVHVLGKGANGSGPRSRHIPTTVSAVPALLTWYLQNVRSKYTIKKDEFGDPLFVTEHCGRVSTETIRKRFKKHLKGAALPAEKYAPHSLRHASATHEAERTSLAFAQAKLSHAFASTTQGYLHTPKEASQRTIQRLVREDLAATRERLGK